MKQLVLLLVFFTPFCLPARAQETWVCAYAYPGTETVIVKFQVNGDDLIVESQYSEKFKILQNNDIAIVAARSFAEIERGDVAIGAFVVLIDKQNGKFQQSNAILGEPQAATGRCTK